MIKKYKFQSLTEKEEQERNKDGTMSEQRRNKIGKRTGQGL